jgi:hypothetical protein
VPVSAALHWLALLATAASTYALGRLQGRQAGVDELRALAGNEPDDYTRQVLQVAADYLGESR